MNQTLKLYIVFTAGILTGMSAVYWLEVLVK